MWLDVVGTKCTVDKCLRAVGDAGPTIKSAGASHPPYDLIYYGLIGFVVRCGTPRMSSPTMWLDVVGTKKYY